MRHVYHINRATARQITPQTVTREGDWRGATWHIYWIQLAARTTLNPPAVSAQPGRRATRSAGRLRTVTYILAQAPSACGFPQPHRCLGVSIRAFCRSDMSLLPISATEEANRGTAWLIVKRSNPSSPPLSFWLPVRRTASLWWGIMNLKPNMQVWHR
jgi:hypothetical protein